MILRSIPATPRQNSGGVPYCSSVAPLERSGHILGPVNGTETSTCNLIGVTKCRS